MLSTDELIDALLALRRAAVALEESCRDEVQHVPERDQASARNLLHYLAVRQRDLRPLQRELARRGLSSLGSGAAQTLASIDAVLHHLEADRGSEVRSSAPVGDGVDQLWRHTVAALGPLPPGDHVRLMVTLPSEAAADPAIIDELVTAGMDLARINCAHDDPDTWLRMAEQVRHSARAHARTVLVAFDLAGPKLRTGPLAPGPKVIRVRPRRTVDGHVLQRSRVRLHVSSDSPTGPPPDDGVAVIPVSDELLDASAVGDEIVVRDARGRRRRLHVDNVWTGAIEATCDRTCYWVTDAALQRRRHGKVIGRGTVGELPPTEGHISVERGHRLIVRFGTEIGTPAVLDEEGTVLRAATISCDVAEVFAELKPGDRLLIDDGTVEMRVDSVGHDELLTTVVRPERAKIKAGKGINLPDTSLSIPALTSEDLDALRVIAPVADLVALSFVSSVDDIARLHVALDDVGRGDVAIVLKIEHAAAFQALPQMLLFAMRRPPVAVMLARGDLAVEIGFERLAEVQEQVLWMCEAAHIPVIWATQVAESLAKLGLPTRAEVTDAAWASRAECVMLNKGPHIVAAVRFLDDVFARMHDHQDKRTPMMRRLSISTSLGES